MDPRITKILSFLNPSVTHMGVAGTGKQVSPDSLAAFADPARQDDQITGPIRKVMTRTFGTPSYADPKIPVNQRVNDMLERYGQTFMGGHGGFTKPVKTGYADILMNKRSAVDALKRYDTTMGETRANATQPMFDGNLFPDLLKQWKIIYGANKKAPQDWEKLVYQVRNGLRAAMKQGQ